MEIVIAFILAFLSGVLNNFSGGGKFIQFPAISLISPTITVAELVATNKLVSLPIALLNLRDVKKRVTLSFYKFIPVLLFGIMVSAVSTYLFLSLNETIQKVLFLVFLVLGFFVSAFYRWGLRNGVKIGGLPFFVGYGICSFYEGFGGAGNGTIITYLLKYYRGKSSADALSISRVLTLGLMLGALAVLIKFDAVVLLVALPVAGLAMVGDAFGLMLKEYGFTIKNADYISNGLDFISCLAAGYLVFA